jgi:hypothetical protein
LGLCAFEFLARSGNVAAAVLSAIVIKTGVPLTAVVLIGSERYKGFVSFVLLFYMVTLLSDTLFKAKIARSIARPRQEGVRHG